MSNLELVVILLALVASGFFSMMEIAFLSSNKLMIELDKKEGGLSAKIVHYFLRHSSLYLGTMLVGNNIALVIYGLYMGKVIIAVLFPELINSDTLTFYPLLIQTSISTLVILFTAEFLPKSIGRINPNKLLQLTWPFILFFGVVLYPITILSIGISEGLLKLFNITDEEESENALRFGKVDLDNYVKEISNRSHDEEGVDHEIQIFKNALDFSKVKSRDCMVPRTEIEAIDIESDVESLRLQFVKTGYSKIFVYKDTIDNIVGYVQSFDLFKKPQEIKSIVKKMLIIPETTSANVLLEKFTKQKNKVALVVDEFGGTSGMLTIEDVIEEIFGEIDDEHDVDDLIDNQLSENEFDFAARLEIDYINEKYGLNIPESDEYETLGGFIISNIKNIPQSGEKFALHNFDIIVTEANETRIERVRFSSKTEE